MNNPMICWKVYFASCILCWVFYNYRIESIARGGPVIPWRDVVAAIAIDGACVMVALALVYSAWIHR